MRCQRCHGLMVVDHFIDMEESGGLWLRGWRCVACGEVVDPMIMRHRRIHPSRFNRLREAAMGKKKRERDIVRLTA